MKHDPQGPATLKKFTLTSQIITIALIIGLVNITAILCFMSYSSDQEMALTTNLDDPTVIIGLAIAIGGLAASMIIPGFVGRKQVAIAMQADGAAGVTTIPSEGELTAVQTQLCGAFMTHAIVGHALIEGPGILNAVLFLINHSAISLGLAGFMIVVLALRFPSATKIQNWVQDKIRDVALR